MKIKMIVSACVLFCAGLVHGQMTVESSTGEILMIVTDEGRVGVGSTNPVNRLHIAGDMVRIDNDDSLTLLIDGSTITASGRPPLPPGANSIHLKPGDRWSSVLLAEDGGTVGIGSSEPTSTLDIQGVEGSSQLRLRQSFTPSSTGDPGGDVGDIAWDDNYFYVKTTAGWKRAALTTF
jgi:hypothetical protein